MRDTAQCEIRLYPFIQTEDLSLGPGRTAIRLGKDLSLGCGKGLSPVGMNLDAPRGGDGPRGRACPSIAVSQTEDLSPFGAAVRQPSLNQYPYRAAADDGYGSVGGSEALHNGIHIVDTTAPGSSSGSL
jgi:hypothetical protein